MNYRHLLLGGSIVLNVTLGWNLIWGEQGLIAYKGLQQELMAINERMDALSKKNVALSREIKLLQSDDRYIEQMVRKRLNFVKDNEIWYIFPGGQNTGAGEGLNETEN